MKRWMAIVVLSLAPLTACGPSKELQQARAEVDSLQKENATLKKKMGELEGTLKKVSQERDQLKVAAAKPPPAPAPAPAPAKKTATRK
jgi:hypothetical protein